MSMILRPFQSEDVAAVLAAHATHASVVGRAATGLGKAVEVAAIASHYAASGRVLILVDVRKLVRQLAATVRRFTGTPPGVEMGDECANNGGYLNPPDRIVVSTVQTMYSGPKDKERYRSFDPAEIAAVLLDECELFLAPRAREVVDYFAKSNPRIRIYGCTATPMRTDGVAMGELFDHVAFNRDICWGIAQGWLVNARQAFVRVSVDWSTLKVKSGGDGGEADFSAADVAAQLANERTLVELAKGIIHVAADRRSIVVCPDVASAKAIAHYLCGERTGCARCVYGEMTDDDKDAVMNAHRQGDYQFLVSVMMLTKGYDDPGIRAVFNCRKTKSKRLYAQILGRGTRPDASIVEALGLAATPDERKALIAASPKSNTLMVNMVGVRADVRDVSLIDILGGRKADHIVERAKEIEQESDGEVTSDEAVALAEEEAELEIAAERLRAEQAAVAVAESERLAANVRGAVQVQARVEVEYQDDLRGGGNGPADRGPSAGDLNPMHVRIIRDQAKFPAEMVAAMSQEQAKRLVQTISMRRKQGLVWSYKVGKLLERIGYSRGEVQAMSIPSASAAIEAAKANNWRRAQNTEAA